MAKSERENKLGQQPEKGLKPFHQFLQDRFDSAVFASKRDRTRAYIRIAGAAELAKVPYHNLRLQDICESAEIALGTFYLHFKTKKELTVDILSEFTQVLWECAPHSTNGATQRENLLAINMYYVESFKENSSLMRCLLQYDEETPEFSVIWQKSNERWLRRAAKRMLPSGLRNARAHEAARFMAHVLGSMVDAVLFSTYIRRDPVATGTHYSSAQIAQVLTSIWYKASDGDITIPLDLVDQSLKTFPSRSHSKVRRR